MMQSDVLERLIDVQCRSAVKVFCNEIAAIYYYSLRWSLWVVRYLWCLCRFAVQQLLIMSGRSVMSDVLDS